MLRVPAHVGVIGCGHISRVYFEVLRQFANLRVVACADRIGERAQARAEEFDIPRCCPPDELLADPDVDIVLNLTTPPAHASLALAALEAGKSVYNEKPLAVQRADGQRILALAQKKGLRVGCAPDTFLGAGLQTMRRLLDDGVIGTPVAAVACMFSHGPESWHPDPDFYYQLGGGPLFDMGPYYLTALIHLFGPVRRVCASARISFPRRTITSRPRCGQIIDVQVHTHVAGVLDFAGGLVATLITSFDVWHGTLPFLEIYGADGSLSGPDPNTFGGPVRLRRASDEDWTEVPLLAGCADNTRGLGLADLVEGLRTGQPHRASGELAYHVLDTMHALHESSQTGRHVELTSACTRPEPLPTAGPPRV